MYLSYYKNVKVCQNTILLTRKKGKLNQGHLADNNSIKKTILALQFLF